MCGIVAYIGPREAYPILIKGLHRLEYRGYDSAGICLLNDDIRVFKCKGKVSDLEEFIKGNNLSGNIGMAHTRWATHGEPNTLNAHPHFSQNKTILCSKVRKKILILSIQKCIGDQQPEPG